MSAGMGGAQGRPGEPLPTFGASPLLDSSPAVAAGLTAAGWVRTDVTHNYQGKGIRSKIFSAWWRRVPLPDIGGDSPRVWSLPSLQAMRTDLDGEPLRDATVVAFDTEFCYDDRAGRLVLSYQFAFVDPADPSRVVEVMVAPLPDAGSPGGARRVPLGQILSWMVAAFQINWDGWSYHGGPHYYDKVPRHKDGSRDYRTRDKDPIDVVLVGHYLPADITALEMGRDQPDLLVRLSSVQGGLVSLPGGKGRPRSTDYIHPAYLENTRKFWSVRVTFRDTMAQSPAGKKSLAALGDAVGVPKLELSEDARLAVARDVELDFQSVGLDDAERAALAATFELDADDADVADDAVKERMDRLLVLRPAEFAEYAAQDALVVLSYELAVWGSGQGGRGVVPPPTLTSAATRVAKRLMGRYLCVPVGRRSGDLFDQVYRGLRRVRDKEKPAPGGPPVPSGSPAPYIQDTTLRPLDGWCEEAQAYAIHAYHGGINSCDGVTLHQGHRTWDWDLQNAYPTAMNVVPDVWWNHPQGPIECRLVDVDLDWSFFDKHLGPMTPLYAYVTFDFPRDVKWPCLPLTEGSSLVFPRTSKGADARDAAWACAPELWVALAMGARVHVLKGVVLRHRPRGPIARGGLRQVPLRGSDPARGGPLPGQGALRQEVPAGAPAQDDGEQLVRQDGPGRVRQGYVERLDRHVGEPWRLGHHVAPSRGHDHVAGVGRALRHHGAAPPPGIRLLLCHNGRIHHRRAGGRAGRLRHVRPAAAHAGLAHGALGRPRRMGREARAGRPAVLHDQGQRLARRGRGLRAQQPPLPGGPRRLVRPGLPLRRRGLPDEACPQRREPLPLLPQARRPGPGTPGLRDPRGRALGLVRLRPQAQARGVDAGLR